MVKSHMGIGYGVSSETNKYLTNGKETHAKQEVTHMVKGNEGPDLIRRSYAELGKDLINKETDIK